MTESPRQHPASGVSHLDALPPGARLAEFEILALLGVGGFGMVYKAFDHSLHRAVAIKEYMPSAMVSRSEGQSLWVRSSADQQTFHAGLASFVGEARLLAQFDHPSLVKVFRFWEANNTAYMVMPLYSGMTFKQARALMRTPPPEAWLRKVLWSVLGALRVLHDGKTLHRDISPDNIFLQYNGPPVLLDLGAARHAINDQDRHHTAVLKVHYAPIEQYAEGSDDGLRQGPWSDLYSLAAVVHGCLCNDTPLPATLRSIRDRMVPFSRVAKTVKRQFGVEYSAPFVAAISQSLALRPQDRPQNLDAFLQTLQMTAPPQGIGHFDFRADLGDAWLEPSDPTGLDLVTPTVEVRPGAAGEQAPTRATGRRGRAPVAVAPAGPGENTVLLGGPDTLARLEADTVFADTGDSVALGDSRPAPASPAPLQGLHGAQPRAPAPAGRLPRAARPSATPGLRRPPVLVWLGVAVFVVVASAAVFRWAQGSKPVQDDIITEMAEQPGPSGEALDALAVTAPAVPAPVAAASVASEGAGAAATPAFVVAPAARMLPGASPRAASVSASAALPDRQPPPAPPPAPPAAVAQPGPRAVPARVPTPQEACAESNFLARPLCIHQECQKPSQAAQPICVENRQRYEADEQRRRQTPQ